MRARPIAYLLGVKVLCAISVLFEQLATSMTEQLVVGNLNFERTRVPLVIELHVIGVDERQFLICLNMSAILDESNI